MNYKQDTATAKLNARKEAASNKKKAEAAEIEKKSWI